MPTAVHADAAGISEADNRGDLGGADQVAGDDARGCVDRRAERHKVMTAPTAESLAEQLPSAAA